MSELKHIEAIEGLVRSEPLNRNFSYVESKAHDAITTAKKAEQEVKDTVDLFDRKTTFDIRDFNNDIQSALNAAERAEGGVVFVPDGVYDVNDTLEIFDNTHLKLSNNAVLNKTRAFSPMILNGRKNVDEFTRYNGNSNIIVEGGTIDANGQNIDYQSSEIMFAHCENIIIKDVTFLNNHGSHSVELNSTRNGKIVNCTFLNQIVTRHTEQIQIDGMFNSDVFPYLGGYDNTTCSDILVQGCTFRVGSRGIGGHTSKAGFTQKNIRIIGNHFENLEHQAIRGFDWINCTVEGNTIVNCGDGIQVAAEENMVYRWNIVGNVFHGTDRHAIFFTDTVENEAYPETCTVANNSITNSVDRAIYVRGGKYITINGNAIRNCQDDGIQLIDRCRSCSIVGNTVENVGDQGIQLYRECDRNVIANNTVVDSKSHAIQCDVDCEDNEIIGNNVWMPRSYGIVMSNGSSFGLIASNKVVGASVGGSHIRLSANVSDIHVIGNHCRSGYPEAIYLTNTVSNCFVTNNFCRGRSIVINSDTSQSVGNWSS